MYYFPIISSGYRMREERTIVHRNLERLYNDLESLIHWEETYNRECGNEEQPEHIYLKNVIDKLLNKTE